MSKKTVQDKKNNEFLQMCSWIEKELMGYTGTQEIGITAFLYIQLNLYALMDIG
ncbi:hypothetical protein [Blautia difficilis]|uniref:Uncharacterized protein n=1 Tax=Blautia difficilis TaxID=2763027 RepID=A0ABR7IJN7_9FIRM|nr:hypothetical protein [Blautia difficilis]MBC5780238.1 hypothetical protein [Blautia difficilis]